jgi:hypothetical protein
MLIYKDKPFAEVGGENVHNALEELASGDFKGFIVGVEAQRDMLVEMNKQKLTYHPVKTEYEVTIKLLFKKR